MKIKIHKIIDAAGALLRLGQHELHPSWALHLFRNKRILKPEFEGYEETHLKLLLENGAVVANGQYKFDPVTQTDSINAYTEARDALRNTEISVSIKPMPFEALTSPISEEDLTVLADWFIVIPPEPAEEEKEGEDLSEKKKEKKRVNHDKTMPNN